MEKCNKCILPINYPGININQKGICSFCETYRPRKYLGEDALRRKIENILEKNRERNKIYDCVVGISGGRDSTYILWYMVNKIKVKVIAYSADSGFVTDVAKRNMDICTKRLSVDFVIEKMPFLNKCFKHNLKAFMKSPSPAMIGMLCTGCRLGMDLGRMNFAKKNSIPIVISGGSPMEVGSYKTGLLRSNPNNKRVSSFILGYMREVYKNPKYLLSYPSLSIQFKEFYHHFWKKTLTKNVKNIAPFYEHIEWDEEEINNVLINTLGWEYNSNVNSSTWKTDCYIAPLKKYLYKKMLGFNDTDDHLSALVRCGQITREDSLKRLPVENRVPQKTLIAVCKHLQINLKKLEECLLI